MVTTLRWDCLVVIETKLFFNFSIDLIKWWLFSHYLIDLFTIKSICNLLLAPMVILVSDLFSYLMKRDLPVHLML